MLIFVDRWRIVTNLRSADNTYNAAMSELTCWRQRKKGTNFDRYPFARWQTNQRIGNLSFHAS
jgi:hypothetical protein